MAEAAAPEAREGSDEDRETEGDRRRRRRGRRGGRPRVRRDLAGEAADRPVAAETIEIVPPVADTTAVEETDAAAAFAPWPGDAGLETASLAPFAGDEAKSPPAHAEAHGAEEEIPPTAEAEPGIPFVSEEERVLEEATADFDSAAGQASPAEAPAANHNEDVLTVTEKPANPRRGWWQRLIQP